MHKVAFKMQLKPGCLEKYRRRHDDIWPELVTALKAAGISDYSIFHDPATDALFATLWRTEDHAMDGLPGLDVMQRWWASMAPLMETNPDGSPACAPLPSLFHLA